MGLSDVAIHSIAVIVERNPGEYNSLPDTLPFVNSIGEACRESRLFSMSNPNDIGSYAVTILGLRRAERYWIEALAEVKLLSGGISVNFGKVLINEGIYH